MIRNGTLTLVLWSMLASTAFSQATGQPAPSADSFGIRGKIVLDVPVPPSERIEVRLELQVGQVIETVYSDAVGNFMFPNLRSDIYYVRVIIDGFREVRERVEVSGFTKTATVTIFMESEPRVTRTDGGGGIVDVSELRSDFPEEAVEAYEKAQEAAEDGDSRKAVEQLETAVRLAPDFYQARNDLGLHLLRLKRYADAQSELETAVELNPNTTEPLLNLGSLHLEEGEAYRSGGELEAAIVSFAAAVTVLEKAVAIDTTSAVARYLLGSALYRTDALERAEMMLDAALTFDEGKHEARLMLVNVYMKQRRYLEVVELLSEYLELNPDSPQREAVEAMKNQIEQALKPGP